MIRHYKSKINKIWMMIQFTKDNGKVKCEKDTEYRYGIMEQDMKDIGLMIVSMVKGHFITMKATYILVNF